MLQAIRRLSRAAPAVLFSLTAVVQGGDPAYYVKRPTWYESMFESLQKLAEEVNRRGPSRALPDLGRSDFTLACWIKTKSSGGTLIAKAPLEGRWVPNGKAFFLRGGMLAFDVGWVGAVHGSPKLNDGAWHHVAVTGRRPLRFFVDGEIVKEGTLELEEDPPGSVFKIGFCTADFPEPSGFKGLIDEVRIYGAALSGSEIAAIARGGEAPGKTPLGKFSFENGARDDTGHGNDGVIRGARPAQGKVGKALRFDGKGVVILPGSLWQAGLARLWKLVGRDFPGEADRREMRRERADGIWDRPWEGDLRGLALRYAEACKDEFVRKEALKKAKKVRTPSEVWAVRKIYHTPPPIRFPESIPLDKDPALEGWWQFDQEKGAVAKDSSPHGRDGFLSEGFSFDKSSERGRFGYALRFDGRSYVTARGYKGVLGTAPRTVCLWIKTKERRGDLVTWGLEDAGHYFRVGHIRGRPGVTPYGGYLYIRDFVNDDKWHHFAVVVGEAELPNLHDNVTLYLDGEPAVIDDIGLLDLWPIETEAGRDVTIGKGFSGLIDEVRIYSRALSEDEIRAIYEVKPRAR